MGKGGYLGGSTIVGPRSTGWFGLGSPTMQPSSIKQGTSKPKKRKGVKAVMPAPSLKGTGLTIPEQIVKARKRVDAVEADIAKTRKRLTELDRQLVDAKRQLTSAQNLPRRSAIGRALVEEEKLKP